MSNYDLQSLIEVLGGHVRVVTAQGCEAIQIYNEYGTKMSISKNEVTQEQFDAFKSLFQNL